MGAFPPCGYLRNLGNLHQLIPYGEVAEVVQMIFAMAVEGKKNWRSHAPLKENIP